MEQLQPILKYRFWILFGVAILAPGIGWMISSKAMTEEVDKTWKNVDGKFEEANKAKSGAASSPNASYAEGLKKITDERAKAYGDAHIKLRDEQKKLMVWPNAIAEEMAKIGYLKEPSGKVLYIYNDSYLPELDRVRNIVTPYDPEEEAGLVDIPVEVLPRADMSDWIGRGPTAAVLWDTQEDIWLMTAIMEAVARVNKDATSIVDAPIKSIFEVTLRGGSAQKAQTPSKMSKKAQPVEKASDKKDEKKGPTARPVDFDPRDEFGEEKIPNPKAQAAKTQNEDDGGKRGRKRVKEEAGGPVGEPAEITKRYIDGDNNSDYKVRGFYIKLAMKNTFVPELLAELSNMAYPTEIVRVQMGDEVNRSFVRGRIEKSAPSHSSGSGTSLAEAGGAAARKPVGLIGGGANLFSKGASERAGQKSENRERAAEKKNVLESKGKSQNARGDMGAKDLLQASLEDPYLGTVVISGTMMIYKQYFENGDPNMKPNPSVKNVAAAAPAEEDGKEQPAPEKSSENGATQPAATTDNKKANEKVEAGKTTNGK